MRRMNHLRNGVGTPFDLLIYWLIVFVFWRAYDHFANNRYPEPSKKTTVITAPLDEKGYVDYVRAISQWRMQGVAAKDNLHVDLAYYLGLPDGLSNEELNSFWSQLETKPAKTEQAYVKLSEIVLPVYEDDASYFGESQSKDDFLNRCFEQVFQCMDQKWDPKEYPLVGRWTMANQEGLDKLIRITKNKNRLAIPIISTEDYRCLNLCSGDVLQSRREFRMLLHCQIMRAVFEKKFERAIDLFCFAQKVSPNRIRFATDSELRQGVWNHKQLLQTEIYLLEHVDWDPKLRQRLKRGRLSPPGVDYFIEANTTNRYACLDTIQRIHQKGFVAFQEFTGLNVNEDLYENPVHLKNFSYRHMFIRVNQFFDQVDKYTNEGIDFNFTKKFSQSHDRILDEFELRTIETDWHTLELIRKSLQSCQFRGELLGLSMLQLHSFGIAHEQIQRNQTLEILVSVAKKSHREFSQHRDQNKIEEFLKGFAKTKDPCNGKPFHVRKIKNGFMIYGLGINGKDDGGKNNLDEEHGDQPYHDDHSIRIKLNSLNMPRK